MALRLSPAPTTATVRRHALVESPIGPLALVEEAGALVALSVEGARQGPVPASFGARDDSLLPHVREQLGEYFAGRLQEFDADVVLHDRGQVLDAAAQAGLVDLEWYELSPAPGGPRARRLYVLARPAVR